MRGCPVKPISQMRYPRSSLSISNVPGSRKEKYCIGAKMLHVYPVSAIGLGLALNITLISYLISSILV